MITATHIFTISLPFALACIYLAVKIRTTRSMGWCGMALAVCGLCSTLFISGATKSGHTPALQAFYVNAYLVLATIGANMFSTAICFEIKDSRSRLLGGRQGQAVDNTPS